MQKKSSSRYENEHLDSFKSTLTEKADLIYSQLSHSSSWEKTKVLMTQGGITCKKH